jgi:PAS domain S-box-containing protein
VGQNPNHGGLSYSHLMKILNLLHDGVYISDRSGKTITVNTPYESLTGISASQVVGKNVVDLVEEGIYDVAINPEVVATGQSVTSVQEVNGRKVVLHGHPILNQQGGVELVVTFVRDITVFSRLKEEITAQKALVDYYQRQVSTLNPEEVFLDEGMVAVSQASKTILQTVKNIAPTDVTVLIVGETGVGKDLVAQRIFHNSTRSGKRMLKVDCAAIPESLVESELFGYSPGAFSGARSKGKKGLFESANYGTIFLDEIGELSLPMQTKLLRVIQDQEVIRVGSTDVTKIDVRIIAATNKNLEKAVAKGTFRSDLFYRLKVAEIDILPLRERRDDILPLLKVFLWRYNSKYKKNVYLSSRAENTLLNHNWPGNVRELQNTIHSIVVNAKRPRASLRDLPRSLSSKADRAVYSSIFEAYNVGQRPFKEIISQIERDLINDTLKMYGSVAKVAEVLQVDRTTVFRKRREKNKS